MAVRWETRLGPHPHPACLTPRENFFSGTIADLANALEREDPQRVYVDGGTVVSQFIAAGLLDGLTISVVPVVLGDGIRLFQETRHERRLKLVGSEAFATGLVQLRYRLQAGPVI